MRKLLDRYVLGIFLPALLLFTVTLLLLFLVVDCASKLGKFLELQNQPVLRFIVRYYVCRIPMFVNIVIPCVTLFSAAFTVIKLARGNELLPMATSGISLRRMSLPFVLTSLLAGVGMAAVEEYALPFVGGEIAETEEIFSKRGYRFNIEDYDGHTKLFAQRLDIDQQLIYGEVRITRLDDSMEPLEIISAARAQWDPKLERWVAFTGSVEYPQEIVRVPGEKPRPKKVTIPPEGHVVESKLTPKTLRKDVGVGNRFSFLTLREMIQEMIRYPHVPSKVMFVHARFSFPLSPIVLLLVGLPFVIDPQSKSFIKGLIFCFLLAVGFLMTHLASLDLANKGSIPPIVGAWFPVASFGAVGLVAFARMRT
ncbi:MAG: LptF/LptG family permease [Planctomycetes bacterium]|nr:LptF/LptG family permease [Planctomycetota bacterium]